ncbi:sensor histidine kinase [Luteolibacter sp. GHJ8]|uniref:Sensor histidine kinase n=1 Tax=Luteolibacter rhizosphaerae TaxID=2989719 RepID=A0ABT3FWP7_9BACT|nr:sensor histidine kinase [Luteolibacter rhizosphaerae]MCW1912023.1 sensor histidine kinase [Luteolibacter rhizosphaerae]
MNPARRLVLLCCALWAGRGMAGEIPTIRELQVQATAEPFKPVEVRARGIVTWIDPTEGKFFQMQDDSGGGVQVSFTNIDWPLVGDTIEVSGILERGPYAPVISQASFVHKGKGTLPKPANSSGGGLVNGEYNGELVDVHGFVRSAEMVSPTTFSAVLSSGSARVTVRVSNAPDLKPEELIAAQVYVTGVPVPVRARGGLRQLVDIHVLAPRRSFFNVLKHEESDPWLGPVLPLRDAFQYRPGFRRGDRIRVRGEVIDQREDIAYINDGRNGIAVRGIEAAKLKRGEEVEAVGFPDIENFLPILSDAVFVSYPPEGNTVSPRPMSADALMDGLQHAAYVTVQGRLLDRMQTGGIVTLALNTPDGVFTAEMDSPARTIPDLEEGCTAELNGICLVSTDGSGSPASFKILLRGPESVRIVERASFFTVKRLLVMLSIALGSLAAVAIFAWFSTRRNLRLAAEMRERAAVTAERNRLARDLHDTLEQGLTGIHLQLHSIGKDDSDASPETRNHLDAANSLVRQCHAEMRSSIWNLRSVALEEFDLAGALERSARSLVLGSGIRVDLKRGAGAKLPPLIEDNLLRIGQEAITNAVKHASPSHLVIDLSINESRAILAVADDGSGIKEPAARGHFGLTGMHERAARIGGTLRILPNPAGGTIVTVEVPLPSRTRETRDEPERSPTDQDPRRRRPLRRP